MKYLKLLKKSRIFHLLEDDLVGRIINDAGSFVNASAGKQIFFQGDEGRYFYILVEGKVRITRMSLEGKDLVLKDILPGDSFAEVILFEQEDYPATATAIIDSKLFRVDKKVFREFLLHPEVAVTFISNILKKNRFLNRKIELIQSAHVHDRFYLFLETYYGRKEEITIKESKKDIAHTIGTIPETFSRMISKLKKEKIIVSWDKKQLKLRKGFWLNY